LNSINRGVFIRVQGGVTNLIKSVTRQVLAGQPSHVAGQPPSLAATNFILRIPCYRLLERVSVKQTRKRLQSGAGQPGSLVGCPPPRPTGQWPLRTASTRYVYSHGDTLFWWNSNFPYNFLKCSNLAPMFLKSNKH
jgi:hypothetical protein